MGLKLQPVAARQGWTWARDGARLFLRRPMAFSAMLMLFLLASFIWMTLPVVNVLALAVPPLLSLGFMVASRSVLQGGPAHPGQLIEPLTGPPLQRRRLLALCGLYAVGAFAVVVITGWVYGDALELLRRAVTEPDPGGVNAAQAAADPRLSRGALVLGLLGSALSIPFWHAPALVLWGGQSVSQSLFSSTLSLWRARGAYLVYGLAWIAAALVFGLAIGLLAGVLGVPALATMVMPVMLIMLAAFYTSLWFSFVDCFGTPDGSGAATGPAE